MIQKAELEGYKSEEAPAISGIKQDAVVDSRIIEESRVEDKHYTGEGKPLAETSSTDVVAEEKCSYCRRRGIRCYIRC
ncbi:type IV secretion system VirB6 family domain protein [Anaplasma phagocytophilum str. CRT53-1]|uniref:Type IV secretion system VirB6 family domain protein n=1 Tax=Anaplasma phagocytophilum str. CRT53-1 TaxID=1359157 RepID=A0A0F3Q5I1_ANAPH|nr:hypothetical protein [Anaplasma phagocytophilum]KJV86694.1 type IV secretion system VirB6 family domain protein [Anaplasma phagocytophilum str. CRT53-1]